MKRIEKISFKELQSLRAKGKTQEKYNEEEKWSELTFEEFKNEVGFSIDTALKMFTDKCKRCNTKYQYLRDRFCTPLSNLYIKCSCLAFEITFYGH